jgi:23S rRNA (cytidine1920-2'-O)/16S rRNA (cytidine1409-2'-O)-methyltransferase
MRLDQALVECGLSPTRSQAQDRIKRGFVTIDGNVCTKTGQTIKGHEVIKLLQTQRYVSRAGEKLEEALKHFQIDALGKNALDIGASTGGFTDCMLQRGAKHVTAVDVGHGQLAQSLRTHPQVRNLEKTDARNLSTISDLESFSIVTIDVSFISILKILPHIMELLDSEAVILALIKPQFEVGKENIGKGGLVKNQQASKTVIDRIGDFFKPLQNWTFCGSLSCSVKGSDGNQEYFVCVKRSTVSA